MSIPDEFYRRFHQPMPRPIVRETHYRRLGSEEKTIETREDGDSRANRMVDWDGTELVVPVSQLTERIELSTNTILHNSSQSNSISSMDRNSHSSIVSVDVNGNDSSYLDSSESELVESVSLSMSDNEIHPNQTNVNMTIQDDSPLATSTAEVTNEFSRHSTPLLSDTTNHTEAEVKVEHSSQSQSIESSNSVRITDGIIPFNQTRSNIRPLEKDTFPTGMRPDNRPLPPPLRSRRLPLPLSPIGSTSSPAGGTTLTGTRFLDDVYWREWSGRTPRADSIQYHTATLVALHIQFLRSSVWESCLTQMSSYSCATDSIGSRVKCFQLQTELSVASNDQRLVPSQFLPTSVMELEYHRVNKTALCGVVSRIISRSLDGIVVDLVDESGTLRGVTWSFPWREFPLSNPLAALGRPEVGMAVIISPLEFCQDSMSRNWILRVMARNLLWKEK